MENHIALKRNIDASAPIGIFDSGIGGLSVAHEVLRHLPHEQMMYYADTAHVPYGERSADDIRQLTHQAIQWLYEQGCKLAIVACNSASAFSLDGLRAQFGSDFPIIGLVPAVKPAVIQSKTKVIAVLATAATFRGKLIQDVIADFAVPHGVQVIQLTAPELVPLIEQGRANSEACATVLKRVLQPAVEQQADHVVLGCTHYPFLRPAIQTLYGARLQLLDSGVAVARQCGRILANQHLLAAEQPSSGRMHIVFSGHDAAERKPIVQQLFGLQTKWDFHSTVNIQINEN